MSEVTGVPNWGAAASPSHRHNFSDFDATKKGGIVDLTK